MYSYRMIRTPLASNVRRGLGASQRRPIPYSWRRLNSHFVSPGESDDADAGKGKGDDLPTFKSTLLKMFESAATTFASIAVLGYEIYRLQPLNEDRPNGSAGSLDIHTINTTSTLC
jgi:hypothetical protein